MVFHIVVNVHLIEKIWTLYIVFDAVTSDVLAKTLDHSMSKICSKIFLYVVYRDTILMKSKVIVWADNDFSVFSAKEYVKRGDDCLYCITWVISIRNVTLTVGVSKLPDKFPAIDFKGTFLIIVCEFVGFDCLVIKTKFQFILLIKAKDFSAISLSVFSVIYCFGVSKKARPV